MANLKSIAEQAWLQVYPKAKDEATVPLEVFIATAKTEYSYQMWIKHLTDKANEGEYPVPSYLLTEEEFEVIDDEIDLTGLEIMRSLHADIWLQNVGGIDCKDCKYIKTTVNHAQLLCDDDSLPSGTRTYLVIGKKLKFPKGVHKNKLPITYANSGKDVDGEIEIDDVIAGIVRRSLLDIFLGKINAEDKTNDSNPNQ